MCGWGQAGPPGAVVMRSALPSLSHRHRGRKAGSDEALSFLHPWPYSAWSAPQQQVQSGTFWSRAGTDGAAGSQPKMEGLWAKNKVRRCKFLPSFPIKQPIAL